MSPRRRSSRNSGKKAAFDARDRVSGVNEL